MSKAAGSASRASMDKLNTKRSQPIRRLAMIAHQAQSLVNFRGPLIRECVARGVAVLALAPDYDDVTRAAVAALGATPVESSLSRATINPWQDLQDFLRLRKQLRQLAVEISFSYTIKPVIYGTLAAAMSGVPSRFALIEGAGHLYTDDGRISLKRVLLRTIVSTLYALALSQAEWVFVLNRDDKALFSRFWPGSSRKIVQLDGIGLDLMHYFTAPVDSNSITFICVARLLREKGIYDYLEAARRVRTVCPSVSFILVGSTDRNPTSVRPEEIEEWRASGLMEIVGHVADVRPWLQRASVFVLPSYREGLPRSTQEAMAMGRAVITTDVPGCRDTVVEGVNGFIVPVRDPASLADAMLRFVQAPQLVARMGANSREIAQRRFDVHRINAQIFEKMDIEPPGNIQSGHVV